MPALPPPAPRARRRAAAAPRPALLLLAALLLAGPARAQPALGPDGGSLAAQGSRPAVDPRAAYLAVIRELRAGGQHYAVLAHLKTLEEQFGPSPESLLLQADALRATGQGEAAAKVYPRLLGGPLAAAGHHGLGLLAGARGDLPEAVRQLGRAAALAPTHATIHGDHGYALLAAGRLDEARAPLLTAAQLAPDDARILANLALLHARSGEAAAAEAVLARPAVSEASRQYVRAVLANNQRATAEAAPGPAAAPGAGPPGTSDAAAPAAPASDRLPLQLDYRLPAPRPAGPNPAPGVTP